MKTLPKIPKIVALALILAASAILFSCVPKEIKFGTPPIVFKEHLILIPRVLDFPTVSDPAVPDDLKALNEALSAHDKALYQVAFYDRGVRTEVKGTLGCIKGKAVTIIDAAAKKSGASDVAFQVGAKKKAKWGPGVSCYARSMPQELEADTLVRKVTPILKTYAGR